MKKVIIFLLGIIFLSSIFYFLSFGPQPTKLKVGSATLNIEIADSPTKREQGLSDRKSLCENCGMLFLFGQPGLYPIWMRRMHFNIDIMWIRDNKVVEITYGVKVPPLEEIEAPRTLYQSEFLVDSVLEVNPGWVKKNQIKIGDRIE